LETENPDSFENRPGPNNQTLSTSSARKNSSAHAAIVENKAAGLSLNGAGFSRIVHCGDQLRCSAAHLWHSLAHSQWESDFAEMLLAEHPWRYIQCLKKSGKDVLFNIHFEIRLNAVQISRIREASRRRALSAHWNAPLWNDPAVRRAFSCVPGFEAKTGPRLTLESSPILFGSSKVKSLIGKGELWPQKTII
jgi:hypothetical protein